MAGHRLITKSKILGRKWQLAQALAQNYMARGTHGYSPWITEADRSHDRIAAAAHEEDLQTMWKYFLDVNC